MATYTEDGTFASKGVGNAGLALGIVGTSLASGILNGNGIGGIFGNGSRAAQAANDAVMMAIAQKDSEIAQLKADKATDAKLVEVYKDLRAQDKAQDAVISSLKDRVSAIETAAPLREQIVLGQVQAVAQGLAEIVARLGSSGGRFGSYREMSAAAKCLRAMRDACRFGKP